MSIETPHPDGDLKRRDFLFVATGVVAAVGAVMTAWPFIDQMEPSSAVLAASSVLEVDLSSIEPGQQILLQWQKKPIFVVRRTPENLATLKDPKVLAQLRDPDSTEAQQPPYAKNWSRSIMPDYLVLIGICTHLGCIPDFRPIAGALGPGWPGGYLCPCHGSRYDLAGRVFQNVPAPLNLPVPPYRFTGPTSLAVGENPPGQAFTMSDVEAL